MNLYFYRGKKSNFGDELNTWMWPKLIDGVWDEEDQAIFLGIGSIIFDFFPADKKKIVFGAGYGGYTPLPVIDKNWKFYFVRGKLTARASGISESLGIGDAAILLRSCIKQKWKNAIKFLSCLTGAVHLRVIGSWLANSHPSTILTHAPQSMRYWSKSLLLNSSLPKRCTVRLFLMH